MLARRFSLPTTIMILAMMRSTLMQHLDLCQSFAAWDQTVMRSQTGADRRDVKDYATRHFLLSAPYDRACLK